MVQLVIGLIPHGGPNELFPVLAIAPQPGITGMHYPVFFVERLQILAANQKE